MTDNSDDNKVYTVKRTPKLWIVVKNNGAARPPGIYHFDSCEEAEAFAKAEQTRWDEEDREWSRRIAEYEREFVIGDGSDDVERCPACGSKIPRPTASEDSPCPDCHSLIRWDPVVVEKRPAKETAETRGRNT